MRQGEFSNHCIGKNKFQRNYTIIYSISNMQICFEYIIKNQEKLTDKPPIQIYFNKIQSIVKFKNKPVYFLELLTTETMRLLRWYYPISA